MLRRLEVIADQTTDARQLIQVAGHVATTYAQLATAEAVIQLARAVSQLEFAAREELERIDDALRNTVGGRP